jgi:hypothetical protein
VRLEFGVFFFAIGNLTFYEFVNRNLGDILLEEAELSDDGQFWIITVSF